MQDKYWKKNNASSSVRRTVLEIRDRDRDVCNYFYAVDLSTKSSRFSVIFKMFHLIMLLRKTNYNWTCLCYDLEKCTCKIKVNWSSTSVQSRISSIFFCKKKKNYTRIHQINFYFVDWSMINTIIWFSHDVVGGFDNVYWNDIDY